MLVCFVFGKWATVQPSQRQKLSTTLHSWKSYCWRTIVRGCVISSGKFKKARNLSWSLPSESSLQCCGPTMSTLVFLTFLWLTFVSVPTVHPKKIRLTHFYLLYCKNICYWPIPFEKWLTIFVSNFYLLREERKGRESARVIWRKKRGRENSDPDGFRLWVQLSAFSPLFLIFNVHFFGAIKFW